MRIQLLCSLALALVGASASYGQALQANVPFDFHAGKRVLPAGQYTIDVGNGGMIWIADGKGTRSVVGSIGVGGNGFDHESKLLFNRYGDNYFLSEVWAEGSAIARRVRQVPSENGLALRIAAEPVVLRASLR